MTLLPSCGISTTSGSGTATQEAPDDSVTESGEVKLDGLYVDDSYQSETNEDYRLVYALFTVTPEKKTTPIYSSNFTMHIDEHEYDSTVVSDANAFMNSYYYSTSYEDVPLGASGKLLVTFEVLKSDLEGDGQVTFGCMLVVSKDFEDLKVTTSKIKHADSQDALAKEADPDGYAAEETARLDADAETVERVSSAIRNHYWLTTGIKVDFDSGNGYTLTLAGRSVTGTWTVKNGYLYLQSSVGTPLCLPWSWEDDGSIDLDLLNSTSF